MFYSCDEIDFEFVYLKKNNEKKYKFKIFYDIN